MTKDKTDPPSHLANLVRLAYAMQRAGYKTDRIATDLCRHVETVRVWFRKYADPGGGA